jgi:large subunit ribosomal protein L29
MSQKEKKEKLEELKTEYSREKAAVASGTRPENPGKIRELRKTIARIITIQNETPKKETEVENKK